MHRVWPANALHMSQYITIYCTYHIYMYRSKVYWQPKVVGHLAIYTSVLGNGLGIGLAP